MMTPDIEAAVAQTVEYRHERTAGKLARCVLRRGGGSNPSLLFDLGTL